MTCWSGPSSVVGGEAEQRLDDAVTYPGWSVEIEAWSTWTAVLEPRAVWLAS